MFCYLRCTLGSIISQFGSNDYLSVQVEGQLGPVRLKMWMLCQKCPGIIGWCDNCSGIKGCCVNFPLWWDRTPILQTWNREENIITLVGFEPATFGSICFDSINWAIKLLLNSFLILVLSNSVFDLVGKFLVLYCM